MRRREFIALVGGTATTWPLVARAQQTGRMRRIGVLMNFAADDPEGQARIAAFHQGLQERSWTLGRNARIDVRWGAVDAESSRRYAAEVVGLAPDVILASASAALGALQQTTRTVPIVFATSQDRQGARPRRAAVAARPRRRGDRMKRREFITLLGGAAATLPLTARAQQPGKLPHIGVLVSTSPPHPFADAFLRGLHPLG